MKGTGGDKPMLSFGQQNTAGPVPTRSQILVLQLGQT
jgi:hypothetical protein